ncbi:hypothetical protein Pcinc_017818 [Petrolisthes cinctipes]|uniref:VOC domain-containing protein n=1 Tax=Petrolisthes cinctipes TaxID=88211 RepID=A0AAE1KNE3_PETCI|nr:hypothetical protein Pcinc_017818 [Petrolisthes cinctipes]
MSCSVLHHIEVCVRDETSLFRRLTQGFGFRPFAFRHTKLSSRWALRSGDSIFVITKRHSDISDRGIQGTGLSHCTASPRSKILNSESLPNSNITTDGLKFRDKKSSNDKENGSACPKSVIKTPIDRKAVINGSEKTINRNANKLEKQQENNEMINEYANPMMECTVHSGNKEMFDVVEEEHEHWTIFCCRQDDSHTIDSVFNLALVVKDVDKVTAKVRSLGGTVIREPDTILDKVGSVRYSIVASRCGNVVHTLIDKRQYKGEFLPGYNNNWTEREKMGDTSDNLQHKPLQQRVNVTTGEMDHCVNDNISNDSSDSNSLTKERILSNEQNEIMLWPEGSPITTFIDHVACVCEIGQSKEMIKWYEECFGMKRFITNREDSEAEGFVLGGDIGIRLKALEYWQCAEVGLTAPSPSLTDDDASLKLVLAEALPGVDESQVNTFLRGHGGPGIQHIALHTPTMTATVNHMTKCGVQFRTPPPVYYQEGIKLEEIQETGHGGEVEEFRNLGILLDTEADIFTTTEASQKSMTRYLMQVFTTPIFTEDTFFMEIIHRCGASGFGAGNITALAKSIILHKQQLENAKNDHITSE